MVHGFVGDRHWRHLAGVFQRMALAVLDAVCFSGPLHNLCLVEAVTSEIAENSGRGALIGKRLLVDDF